MDRARVLRQGGHRLAFPVEESVLRTGHGGAPVMAGQLGHLLSVMSLPTVSLGVVALMADRELWMQETFVLLDEQSVEVELLTAMVTVTQPREISHCARAFTHPYRMAVFGRPARKLTVKAVEALG
ncbi:Scr1 family TA system antitoxin-like transcriptional regulator [Streptacidiphilus sp. P02-A3a]|uniref:Scr1 family TA system antitoxin-like transcriptional regulator n=1 Tax=Streptacidiphilus sp. P02-A3a TaxID=2704468 RepID=UPI0015FD5E24|nr:Scr1 family TA system antitoxin-like transcriptional regulator [Streptacidiphilus sp. P02-A3a]QMU70100.1 DNA-binding protein [Streptacidiphilus sp. P02-A3a]QMU70447.1 DNA-binding protein [Streptacidiphilus sp. P02-A3a]